MVMRGVLRSIGGAVASARSRPEHCTAAATLGDAERLAILDALEESGVAWFWASDSENRLAYLSASAQSVLAPDGAQVLGQPLVELFEGIAAEGEDRSERPVSFLLGARSRFVDLVVRNKLDGQGESRLSLSGWPQFDGQGQFLGYRGSAKDVSDSFERQRDEMRMAQFDSLTGLSNRNRMARRLSAVLTAYKAAGRSCALLMIDLDRFKQVNDTLGHPAGDELLRQVAQRLQRIIPSTSEIGRLGGDEFQVILPDLDDRGRLGELAQQIIQMLSQPYSIDGSRAIIGTSVGVAIAPYDGISPEELIKSADMALYAAKGSGRGQYRFYSNELQATAHKRRAIEEDLRDALANGELQVHYQPVVRAEDGRISGFEALLRWEHPDHGWISPGVFMPVAEETNLVSAIGEWVLRQACADAALWPGDIRVAVNISALQFMNDGLCAVVAHALSNSGLSAHRLELEITEGVFMGESAQVDRVFDRLKRLGVRLALDDFGTGYSSLGYLRRAPFDKIKIDQSFVRGATQPGSRNGAIIASIVSLAEALGMETTAEGVETLDELDLVRMLGCSHVQGYIYERPLSAMNAAARLSTGLMAIAQGPRSARAARQSMLRKVVLDHGGHRYNAMIRNISQTGALIEGLWNVPPGTIFRVLLADNHAVTATCRWSSDDRMGVEFSLPLRLDEGGRIAAVAGKPPLASEPEAVVQRKVG